MNDQDVLELKKGASCGRVLGCVLLVLAAGGMFSLHVSSSDVPWIHVNLDFWPSSTVAYTVFSLLSGLGLLLFLGDSGLILDRGQGRAIKWRGFSAPFIRSRVIIRRVQQPLGVFSHLSLRKVVQRSSGSKGGSSKRTMYPVSLEGPGESWELQRPADYQKARRTAERVARFLGLDLHDSSAGVLIVRDPAHLDECLAERMRRTGQRVDIGIQPPEMKIRWRPEGADLVAFVPPLGLTVLHKLAAVILIIVGAISVLGREYMLLAFCIIALGLLARSALVHSRVRVSYKGFTLTRKGLLFSKTRSIPAGELEELLIEPSKLGQDILAEIPEAYRKWLGVMIAIFDSNTLLARSDRLSIRVPLPVSEKEANYVLARIIQHML